MLNFSQRALKCVTHRSFCLSLFNEGKKTILSQISFDFKLPRKPEEVCVNFLKELGEIGYRVKREFNKVLFMPKTCKRFTFWLFYYL